MYSIATDYFTDTGNPFPYLESISIAGFSSLHWCHEWSTDHFYSEDEIKFVKRNLKIFGLSILDIHASNGKECLWDSLNENKRQAGVALVKNRIDMAVILNCDAVIMHASQYMDSLRKSLDELQPYATKRNVKIAIENTMNFPVVDKYLSNYHPDFIALCYDSGHGNIEDGAYEWLDKLKNRLISIHIHDNDGEKDLHQIPFSGTVEWEKLARLLAKSSYKKCVSLEVSMRNMKINDEIEFLAQSFNAAQKLTDMISKEKNKIT